MFLKFSQVSLVDSVVFLLCFFVIQSNISYLVIHHFFGLFLEVSLVFLKCIHWEINLIICILVEGSKIKNMFVHLVHPAGLSSWCVLLIRQAGPAGLGI